MDVIEVLKIITGLIPLVFKAVKMAEEIFSEPKSGEVKKKSVMDLVVNKLRVIDEPKLNNGQFNEIQKLADKIIDETVKGLYPKEENKH